MKRGLIVILVLFQVSTFGMVLRLEKAQPVNTTVYHSEASIPGPIGPNGLPGAQGLPGKDGGTNLVTQLQTIVYPGAQGIPGVDGLPGKDGVDGAPGTDAPRQEIRKNASNGDIETKYDTDDQWQVLLTKCDYSPNSEGCTNGD